MMLTPLAQMLEQSESVEVELSLIDAFPEHPFRVQADEDMERLIGRATGTILPSITSVRIAARISSTENSSPAK